MFVRLFFYWFFFSVLSASAQVPTIFTRLSTEQGQGLSSNVVYDLVQDKRGYFWIATANGLQRFDGERFVSVHEVAGDRTKLPASAVQRMLPVGQDFLLLAFPDLGEVGVFGKRDYTYQPIRIRGDYSLKGREFNLWADRTGEVYLLVYRKGILRYDPVRFSFSDRIPFQLPANFPAPLNLFEDTLRKRIWIPCIDKGIYIHDQKTGKTYRPDQMPADFLVGRALASYPEVADFYIDRQRRHWAFYWGGAQRRLCLNEGGVSIPDTAGLSQFPGYHELRQSFESRSGQLWFYGFNCLYRFDPAQKRFEFYNGSQFVPDGIQYKQVFRMVEDREGNTWICTDNGLYTLRDQRSGHVVYNMSLRTADHPLDITDVKAANEGAVWVSSWGDGVIHFDRQTGRNDKSYATLVPTNVSDVQRTQLKQPWCLLPISDREVWVGCQGGYLVRYNPVERQFAYYTDTLLRGITIRELMRAQDGSIWLGNFAGHLIQYSQGRFKLAQRLGAQILRILQTPDGRIWVTTSGAGLFVLSSDGTKLLRHFTQAAYPSLFSDNGTDIDLLNDSTVVYAASVLHLISTRNYQVQTFTAKDGLPGNNLRRIRTDQRGNLWLITMNGLCRFNAQTRRFISFGKRDGIGIAAETRQADAMTTDGFLVFAGVDGLLMFHPDSYTSIHPPQARLTDVKVNDALLMPEEMEPGVPLQLGYDRNTITFYFSSMAYLEREKLAYYYRLKGLSDQWKRAEGNSVTFSLLPPGDYTFELFSENVEGKRSSIGVSKAFTIRRPFWLSYWFLSLLLMLVVLVILLLHRFRVNRLLAVEHVRNRVARDLHDDMGSTLSTINILSAMASARIATDTPKAAGYVAKITENSQRMMEAMDDIVWSIKPSNDSMARIIARMREFATSLMESKDIDLHVVVDDEVQDVKLNMEARRDFFLIFKEAINNAAKYSGATQVEVRVYRDAQRLHLVVADNGVGFDPATADSGNGLGNMQRRAATMQAKYQLQSKPGAGTRIHLQLAI